MMESEIATKALTGVRVVDMSGHLAGPYATMLMADLGAEVTKVEGPGRGDGSRHWGTWRDGTRSLLFLTVNRGKRSVAVDLRSDEGREFTRRLIRRADVVVESFAPGKREALGFSPADVMAVAPHVIYASVSGSGRSGPLVDFSGYDLMFQAFCGLLAMNGEPDSSPVKIPVPLLDVVTGLSLATTLMAVLRARSAGIVPAEFTELDFSLYDSAVNVLSYNATESSATGKSPQRMGGWFNSLYPYGIFTASDGYFYLGVGNDSAWHRLRDALDLPLQGDSRFATNADRLRNRDALAAVLEPIFRLGRAAEWVSLAESLSIPATELREVAQLLSDEHLAIRQSVVPVKTTSGRPEISVPAYPGLVNNVRPRSSLEPPELGADTYSVAAELGYSESEIRALLKVGTIEAR